MLATKENLSELVERFCEPGQKSFDTETTGLYPYQGDRLFSIILADELGAAYFNFQEYATGCLPSQVLPDPSVLAPCFANKTDLWFAHNAKFDMAMCRIAGIEILARIHCTLAIARLVYNRHLKYGLDFLLKQIGLAKNATVEEYIIKHGLWDWREVPGKKTRSKDLHFNLVPFNIIVPYGLDDGTFTRVLGLNQISQLETISAKMPKGAGDLLQLYRTEMELTKTLFEMEWQGALVDHAYVKQALAHEDMEQHGAEKEFEALTGVEFKDSPKALAKAFDAIGEAYPRNPPTDLMIKKAKEQGRVALGNPCFNADALEGMDSPGAKLVKKQRAADKKAGTYYRSFLYFSDDSNRVHTNFKQSGTVHGRMSSAEPALQTVPKREEDDKSLKYFVRKSFIPPDGYALVMIDYNQMEYRLMLEYAQEMELIAKVLGGLDVHQATAEMTGLKRTPAKHLNFAILYGAGIGVIAKKTGQSYDGAYQMKQQYFSALPNVKRFVKNVIWMAEKRGFIFNLAGRQYHFPVFKKDGQIFTTAYTAPNHLIAGGCADIVKKAMNEVARCLKSRKSKTILQVHDELFLYMHLSELGLVPKIKGIMENAYKTKYLPLTCGVDYSFKSWGDKIAGLPPGV